MEIGSTQQTAELLGAAGASPTPGGDMGKEEFLKLLIAQLQNQDPLDPMDNTAMVAQLAQFSALEQMQNLNETFGSYHQESSLIQSLLLTGAMLRLQLKDGSEVTGMVESVRWDNEQTLIRLTDGNTYPMSDIVSMQQVTY
ncbi:MAG: flagellar hook capping protein [Kiritimatiellae bacterium]|nr:flagellar hook capping protein [Kiritimatiellia bacterium]